MSLLRKVLVALALCLFTSSAFAQMENFVATFQQAVTGTASQFPSYTLYNGLTCFARSTNAAPVYVGNSNVTTSTGIPLSPGQGWSSAVGNSSWIYAVTASGATGYIDCWGN